MGAHVSARLTVFDGLRRANASKSKGKSAASWRQLTSAVCAHAFRQDDPCQQKTKTFQASNVLIYANSAVLYGRPQGVCKNCAVEENSNWLRHHTLYFCISCAEDRQFRNNKWLAIPLWIIFLDATLHLGKVFTPGRSLIYCIEKHLTFCCINKLVVKLVAVALFLLNLYIFIFFYLLFS